MKKVKLKNGVEMPVFGFCGQHLTDLNQCEHGVLDAI